MHSKVQFTAHVTTNCLHHSSHNRTSRYCYVCKHFFFFCVWCKGNHSLEKENQLDATEWFIALIICSTCFGHFYACGVQCLVSGCRESRAGRRLCVKEEGCCTTVQHPSSWTHSLLPCSWPPTTSNQAHITTGGSNTHIVPSSWWWAYKCLKHVEHIISAINHSVVSSWFSFSTHMQRCTDKHTSRNHSYWTQVANM